MDSSSAPGPLTGDFADRVDERLRDHDQVLTELYPGDDGRRQPVHTVYLPADRFTPTTTREWGEQAERSTASFGGLEALVGHLGGDAGSAELVRTKLTREPIEDLRLDFEDGYGDRGDAVEDTDVTASAQAVTAAVAAGIAPPFFGIRFKCFEAPTRRRGLRTLERFVLTLGEAGTLPSGLVLTLPKVTGADQVAVLADACDRLEDALGGSARRLRFELQMETPQMILGPDGRCPIPEMVAAGRGRVVGLHYGTYDYSDSLQIAAQYQSMEHPAADYAKAVMQVAAAGTGLRLSDGSTNILPVGDAVQQQTAWLLHARLVRRSLERGFYQGWDLHPAQLPTRFLATYAFYRDGFTAAATRLRNYVQRVESAILDEPATARALARFVHRGLACGAIRSDELASEVGLTEAQLLALAHPKVARP